MKERAGEELKVREGGMLIVKHIRKEQEFQEAVVLVTRKTPVRRFFLESPSGDSRRILD